MNIVQHPVLTEAGSRSLETFTPSSGYSTGPHLHLQVDPGGAGSPAGDAEPSRAERGMESSKPPQAATPAARCRALRGRCWAVVVRAAWWG